MRICKVCGATSDETKVYGDVCRKHYLQFKRHGRYLPRTIYDPNVFIVDGAYIKIELYDTSGNIRGYAVIDREDFDKVKSIKWYLKQGYVMGTFNGKKVFLHRVINDTPDNLTVDHIDRNPLNNTKANLRNCTHHKNTMNRTCKKTVGVKRVPSGRYQASITYKYQTIYLGTFDTYADAKEARLQAEDIYFGEYRPQ
jgi:hypothetical protein